MSRTLPPLTALRAFEAAGRHQSFTLAARELHVTQAAISRQVRELEAWFGRPLFSRHHRRVALTEAGRRLLGYLTPSFDALEDRVREIRAVLEEPVVSVSVEPSFAALWLVPRLAGFRRARPDIDILIDADARPIDFRADGMHLAIRHSMTETQWAPLESELLAEVSGFPVLSPALLDGAPPPRHPADLMRFPLLHDENRDLWIDWFAAAGIGDLAVRRGPLFRDGAHAMQAAVMGQGVAFGYSLLVEADLRRGALLKPFDRATPLGAYWLVAPSLRRLSEPVSTFVAWLRAEMRRSLDGA